MDRENLSRSKQFMFSAGLPPLGLGRVLAFSLQIWDLLAKPRSDMHLSEKGWMEFMAQRGEEGFSPPPRRFPLFGKEERDVKGGRKARQINK